MNGFRLGRTSQMNAPIRGRTAHPATPRALWARPLGALCLLASCGAGQPPDAGPPDFSGRALDTVESTGRHYSVEVRTWPQPPRKGLGWAEFRVSDASGAPAAGLSLDVQPWMPAHAHGTTVRPTVADSGTGIYTIGNLLFFMAGHWELRTTIGPDFNDVAVASFDVN